MQFKKQITCIVLAATTFAFVGCTTPTRYGRSTGQYIDDQTVTRNVKSALNRDSLTDGTRIQVNTFRGNVHLTGFVQHPIQKQQANDILRRVDGVQYFKNDIVVLNDLPTMRSTQMGSAQGSFNEPSGAEINSQQRYQMEGSSSFQQGSSGWQRGSYNAFGPRDDFQQQSTIREPSGAEAEVEINRNETNNGTRIEREADRNRTNNSGASVEAEVDRD